MSLLNWKRYHILSHFLSLRTLLLLACFQQVFSQTIDSKLLSLARHRMKTPSPYPTPWRKPTPSVRDHIRIVEAFHRSMNDMHYRNIWYGLIARNYSHLIHQMRSFGPRKFIKKAHYSDRMFEGKFKDYIQK